MDRKVVEVFDIHGRLRAALRIAGSGAQRQGGSPNGKNLTGGIYVLNGGAGRRVVYIHD